MLYQCCGPGAGATRNRIILVELEPERDAAPAPTTPLSQTVTVFFFSIFFFYRFNHKKSTEKVAPIFSLTFVCFQKVDLLYSRVGAGTGTAGAVAVSIFFLKPEPQKIMRLRNTVFVPRIKMARWKVSLVLRRVGMLV
jgi:hypothetical protein